jgi:acetyltransferase-like isoleucine patch superfamily enzyme
MIHESVKIHPTARINCEHITIGSGGVVGANCVIEGHRVEIGRDFWMDEGAVIGGGSCHDPCAFLKAGDFLHMGRASQLNIARGITVGDEVGIGIQTQVFTHGAYLNILNGFPVQFEGVEIGSNVWLPNAWVNPGVKIGDNVVVAARSLINKSLPSGCLAGGSPTKVIRENCYPRQLKAEEKMKILLGIISECMIIVPDLDVELEGQKILVDTDTIFDLEAYEIRGPASKNAEVVRNQLRRNGIRFRLSVENGKYLKW